MRFFKGASGKLQIINVLGFLSILIFEYLDRIILGVGLAFMLSGVLSVIAFAIDAAPIYNFIGGKIIFDWLSEKNSEKALSLIFGVFLLVIGVVILCSDLK
jgi:hypothetical protein